MVKRTVEEWYQLFAEQQESGLSAAQFCRERKLCPKHFCTRRRQLRASPDVTAQKSNAFVAVPVIQPNPPAGTEIQLRCGPVTLSLPITVAAPWLAQLIQGLQA